MTVTVKEDSEYCIGQLIALEERIVTCLACYWGINAYDQPGVQDGKHAATRVNEVSLKIESGIKAGTHMSAEDIMKSCGLKEDW